MKRNSLLEYITLMLLLVFLMVLMYYSFYPFKITTLNSMDIDKKEYCRGEYVQVDINFTKHRDIQAKIDWYIVDGIVFKLESPGISRMVGENAIHVSKQIPFSILPGEYSLRVESTYHIHPLREPIVTIWNTPRFKVLEAENCPSDPQEPLGFPDPENKPTL